MFGPRNVSSRSKVMFSRVQQENIIPNSYNGTGESDNGEGSDEEEQAKDRSKNGKNVTDERKDEKDSAKETKKNGENVTDKKKENTAKETKQDYRKNVIEERRDMEKRSKESKQSEKNLKEIKDQGGKKTVNNVNATANVKRVTESEHDALSFTGSERNVLSPNFLNDKEVRALSANRKVRSWLETFEGPTRDKENISSPLKKLKEDISDKRHVMNSLKSGKRKSRGGNLFKPKNILKQSLNLSPQPKSGVDLKTISSTAIPPTIEREADRFCSDTTNNKLSVPSANTTQLSSQQADVSTKDSIQTDPQSCPSIVKTRKRLGNTALLLPSKQQPVVTRTGNRVFSITHKSADGNLSSSSKSTSQPDVVNEESESSCSRTRLFTVRRKISLGNTTTTLLVEPQTVVSRDVPDLLTSAANEAIPSKLVNCKRPDSHNQESLINHSGGNELLSSSKAAEENLNCASNSTSGVASEPDVLHGERSTADNGNRVNPSNFEKVQESISMPKEIESPVTSTSGGHSKTVNIRSVSSKSKSEVSKKPVLSKKDYAPSDVPIKSKDKKIKSVRKELSFGHSPKTDQASRPQRPVRKAVQRLKPQILENDSGNSDSDWDFGGSDFEDPPWEDKNIQSSSDDDCYSEDDETISVTKSPAVTKSTSKTPARSVNSPARSVNSPARSFGTPSCFNTPAQPINARAQPFDSPVQSLPRTPIRKESKRRKIAEKRLLRNSGEEYKTLKEKVVSARSLQPLANCRMKCSEKLNEEDRKVVFQEYWGQRDFDKRVNYISSHVFEKPTVVKRRRDDESGRNRTCTLKYELEINNSRIIVCKKCFLATLCENDGFVKRALLNKKRSLSGVTASDRRGRHPSVRKTPAATIEAVRKHINEFPRYSSHYGRSHSSQMYLGVGMTIQRLFEDYSEQDRNNPKVSLSTYSREFRKMGLKFKPPQIDTCQKCDTYEVTIKTAPVEEQAAIIAKRDAHHKKAEIAYDRKKQDRLNQTDESWLLSFDLQQVLYCPQLTSGKVFYKRQLSIYNLTILDCYNKRGVNHMWNETEGGRGANEISSSLYNYIISDVPAGVKNLTLWSDTCSGQNKNSIVCGALITCVTQHETLDIIDHKFLVPGHTHMECDQVHAAIEKKKRGSEGLHHPSDFFNLVKTVEYRKKTLDVVEMKDKFLDFAALLKLKCQGPLVMRSKNQDGEAFNYGPVQWFRYQKQQPAIVLYKNSHDENAPFKEISFRRRGKLGLNSLQPSKCSSVPRPISLEKKEDLMALLHLVDPAHHDFYRNLPSSADALDIDPDCLPSNDVTEEIHKDLEDS